MTKSKNSIGEALKAKRLEKGLTLEKAALDTKIAQRYIKAIEEGMFLKMPDEVVLKGFVKVYASYLKMDIKTVMSDLDAQLKVSKDKEPSEVVDTPARTIDFAEVVRKATLMLVYIGILIVLVMGLQWLSNFSASVKSKTENKKAQVKAEPQKSKQPAAAVKETPAPASANADAADAFVLNAQIIENSWILVISDGNKIFSGILKAGQSAQWTAKEKIFLKIGNAAGVRVTSDGEVLVEPGAHGTVVSQEFSR